MEKRRTDLRQRAAAGLIGVLALAGAQACELPPGKRLAAGNIALTYRTVPARIVVGEHFEVHFAVCAGPSALVSDRVRVDAHMPEHKHGMNYRPSVVSAGGGSYRSKGWLFHMPGRWEFVFEAGGQRLTDSIRIE